jgi:hypothetical protein
MGVVVMVGHDAPQFQQEMEIFPVNVQRFIKDIKALDDDYLYGECPVHALVADLKHAVNLLEIAVNHIRNNNNNNTEKRNK